ncbi:MAG: SpvB/TcaC N-terminal domain-containing protein, partial [Patescibacteria group bacterium]
MYFAITNGGASSITRFLYKLISVLLLASFFPYIHFASAMNQAGQGAPPPADTTAQTSTISPNASDGSFTYAIPLSVPPGRELATPDLSLQYSSRGGSDHDQFGYGWSIDIPYIERFNKYGIEHLYTGTSSFFSSLSGELVETSTSGEYRPKIETGDFLVYTLASNTWTVTNKQGVTYTFGETAADRQSNPDDSTEIAKWMLSETRDQNDNYVTYSYHQADGVIYPERISYSGYDTTDGIFTIEFDRASRTQAFRSYDHGFAATTTDRISEIRALIDGSWSKQYTLGYQVGDNLKRDLLATVTEAGRVHGETTTLTPHTFHYATSTSDMDIKTTSYAAGGFGSSDVPLYDNGDTDGYRPADVNGDGLTDLIKVDLFDGGGSVYINDGDDFVENTPWTLAVPQPNVNFFFASNNVRVLDVNGDGLADIIWSADLWDNSAQYRAVYLNTGTGWSPLTGGVPSNYTLTLPGPFVDKIDTTRDDEGYTFGDVNGDGLPDILRDESIQGGSPGNQVYLNTGDGWATTSEWTLPTVGGIAFKEHFGRVADINGDGLVDIISSYYDDHNDVGEKMVYLNTGAGWSQDTSYTDSIPGYFITDPWGSEPGRDNGYRMVDFNNDGLLDIIFDDDGGNTGWGDVFVNTGTEWEEREILKFGLASQFLFKESIAFPADINGDGLTDLIYSKAYGSNQGAGVYLNDHEQPDIVTMITTPEGGEIDLTYTGSGKLGDVSGNRDNPSLPFPVRVLESVTHNSTFGNTWSETYGYEDGDFYFDASDLRDRRFSGFGKVTKGGELGTTTTFFHQGNGNDTASEEAGDSETRIGRPYRIEVGDGSDEYSIVRTNYDITDLGDDATFVRAGSVLELSYDGDTDHKDRATSYTYDTTNGSLTTFTEWGEVSGSTDGTFTDSGTDKRSTDFSYATNTAGVVALSQETRKDDSGTTVKQSNLYYDSQALGSVTDGNLTKREDWVSGSTYVDTTWTHNAYGQVTSETDPRGHTTSFGYDTNNLFVASSSNPLSQVTLYEVDLNSGQVATTTDVNGEVFATTFDGVGRPIASVIPDPQTGSAVLAAGWTYTDTAGATAVQHTKHLTSSLEHDTYSYLDGFGRLIQERVTAEASNEFAVRDLVYGAGGLLAEESLPYFDDGSSRSTVSTESDLFTSYAYDPLERITKVSTVVGDTTTSYDQWTETVTDAENNQKDFTFDAFNRLHQVTEHEGLNDYDTTYAWDDNDNLTKLTDDLGHERTITYDGLSRRTTLEDLHDPADASFGEWDFEYDAAGNVATTTDPENQVTVVTFDALNRPTAENFTGVAGTEITYSYDSCTNGVGLLCEADAGTTTTSYTYTHNGLIDEETREIDGASYVTGYTYDRQGNQLEITYPDSSAVRYTYNDANLLETVEQKESGGSYADVISNLDYSPHAQPTVIVHANRATTTRTYADDEMYRLASLVTVTDPIGTGNGGPDLLTLETELFGSENSEPALAEPEPVSEPDELVEEEPIEIPTEEADVEPETVVEDVIAKPIVEEATELEVQPEPEPVEAADTSTTTPEAEVVAEAEVASTTESEPELAATNTEPVAAVSDEPASSTPTIQEAPEAAPETAPAVAVAEKPRATGTNAFSPAGSLDRAFKNMTVAERTRAKSYELQALGRQDRTPVRKGNTNYDIEIVDIDVIDGGVEVKARAWRQNGRQIGFGPDGTVDIERFLIYNPPILVHDEAGEIKRSEIDAETGELREWNLREDPEAALLQVIADTIEIKQQKHSPQRIVRGKVGSTTSTFFAEPSDGFIHSSSHATFSEARNGTGFALSTTSTNSTFSRVRLAGGSTGKTLYRSYFPFDTSSLSSSIIDSATFSVYATWKTQEVATSYSIYEVNLDSSDDIILADYQNNTTNTDTLSDTEYAASSWTNGWKNFAFNANGEAYIDTTGVTEISGRSIHDAANIQPSGVVNSEARIYFADETGTTNDPKLVVEHTSSESEAEDALQHFSYEYDNVGNITKIVNQSLLDNGTIFYDYDDLYRLTRASSSNATSSQDYLRTYAYNALGNLTSKSDQGSYLYAGDTGGSYANPHAPTSIAGNAVTYDNVGNVLTYDGDTNVWNYRQELVTSGDITFAYDHTGDRTLKDTTSGGSASSISYVGDGGITHAGSVVGTTGQIISVPSGVQDGDLLIMVSHRNDNVGDFTTPVGWTRQTALDGVESPGQDRTTGIFTRIAASEPSTYSLTHTDGGAEQWSSVIIAYRGVDQSQPLDVTPTGSHYQANTNDSNPPNSAITTVTDGAQVVLISALTHDDITTGLAPTGYTMRVDHSGGPIDHRQIQIADKAVSSAGTETPGDWLNTVNNTVAESNVATLALRPATAAGS